MMFVEESGAAVLKRHRHDPAHARRRLEREIADRVRRIQIGACAAVVGHARHLQIRPRRIVIGIFGALELPAAAGQQQYRIRVYHVAQEPARDRRHLAHLECTGKFTRHLIQRARAALPDRRQVGLPFQAGGQLAYDQGDRQHHGKGQQVLDIIYGKRKLWRHQEKIE